MIDKRPCSAFKHVSIVKVSHSVTLTRGNKIIKTIMKKQKAFFLIYIKLSIKGNDPRDSCDKEAKRYSLLVG